MKKQFKPIIKAAQDRGWKLETGGRHNALVHPSGRKLGVSLSPSDRNAHRVLQRAIDRVEREAEDGER